MKKDDQEQPTEKFSNIAKEDPVPTVNFQTEIFMPKTRWSYDPQVHTRNEVSIYWQRNEVIQSWKIYHENA